MKQIFLLEPCAYTRLGMLELLKQYDDIQVVVKEYNEHTDPVSLISELEKSDFDIIIYGENSILSGFSSDMEFVGSFYHIYKSSKKFLMLSSRINAGLLAYVYGVQADVIDRHISIDDLIENINELFTNKQRGRLLSVESRLLTPMQRKVLVSYLKGIPMTKVAKESGKSPKTLSCHKRSAMKILGVTSPQQLLQFKKKRNIQLNGISL